MALTTLNAQVPATPLTVTYTYSGLPLPLPVDSADVAALLYVTVPRSLTITKVTASVQVNYPAVGDLNVYMFFPE
jgi:subtilisin-like proprotein convertase family protein